MIRITQDVYILETANTQYIMKKMTTGHLEMVYYGAKCYQTRGLSAMVEKRAHPGGTTISYDRTNPALVMEDVCLVLSAPGKGDLREPSIALRNENGTSTSDFVVETVEMIADCNLFQTLPEAIHDPEDGRETMKITMVDRYSDVVLELYFTPYETCDVITRRTILRSTGAKACKVRRLMSMHLDLPAGEDYRLLSYHGSWANEMNLVETKVQEAAVIVQSRSGFSGNRANPFVILAAQGASEDAGECYASNLIYSGNHYVSAQKSAFGKVRLLSGIHPDLFGWTLEAGEVLEIPEAVFCYSQEGYQGISRSMHQFVRSYVVRGPWANKERPILLNSWEACYFSITESKLLRLAKAGKEAGIELFVVDDGWFGSRNDDTSSLGDWYPNLKKLPGGLKRLGEKICKMGMQFGIWVEPEMVSENSELYRKHPDWVLGVEGKEQSLGRNQYLLDLTQEAVVEYLIKSMSEVFASAPISYVKWDMNRNMSDVFARYLPPDRQEEVSHRYMLGLYQVLRSLQKKFPEILMEACASGGNRSDLGMLCYMQQIWGSDNTDAICRTKIQEGYSYGYPQSVITTHVSSAPNHQTLRVTPLETRFQVACFGVLGYECNLVDMKQEERKQIAQQIEFYKQWRKTFQFGDLYRRGKGKWLVIGEDGKNAAGLLWQSLSSPGVTYEEFKTRYLPAEKCYHVCNRVLPVDVRDFGELINMISPVHIRQGSVIHNVVAKFMKLPGEKEDVIATGSVLNHCGIKLKQAYGGTGFDEDTRLWKDFSSRLYLMTECQEDEECCLQ